MQSTTIEITSFPALTSRKERALRNAALPSLLSTLTSLTSISDCPPKRSAGVTRAREHHTPLGIA